MEAFLNYLNHHDIQYEIADPYIVIDNCNYVVAEPIQAKLLSDDFHLNVVTHDQADYYVNYMDNRFFRVHASNLKSPVFQEIKWLGKINQEKTINYLGVHGHKELLNGNGKYEDWAKKAQFMGIKSLGICEKNSLRGIYEFQKACLNKRIKPILGMTFSVLKDNHDFTYSLKAFIYDQTGYQNLLKINAVINAKTINCITESRLVDFQDGLIFIIDPATLPYQYIDFPKSLTLFYILNYIDYDNVKKKSSYLDNLTAYANDTRLKPVCLNDACYLDQEDWDIKQLVNDIGSTTNIKIHNQYLKPVHIYKNEIKLIFNEQKAQNIIKLSLDNLNHICEKCNYSLPLDNKYLPEYKMNEGQKKRYKTNTDLFLNIIDQNFISKIPPSKHSEYRKRFNYEYEIIKEGQLVDYFLILWDIIEFCKEQKILVSYGRGSASGSIISYLLGLTHADPIHYDLLFERFLTKTRIKSSLPDIDLDFPTHNRDEIYQYIIKKYGFHYVCRVGSMNNFNTKELIKRISKSYGYTFDQSNALTKSLSNNKEIDFNELIHEALHLPKLKQLLFLPGFIKKFLRLYKNAHNVSIHASAVMIVPKAKTIYECMPIISKPSNNGHKTLYSEFSGDELESLGYLKEDLLTLNTLDIIQSIIDEVYKVTGQQIDMYKIPLNDEPTFENFRQLNTANIFQYNSRLQRIIIHGIQPANIEDLIIINALVRPGPLTNNYPDLFIKYKKNPGLAQYLPGLKEVTQQTYGMLIFQEQTIQAFKILGNFTLEEGEIIRKGLSKKKKEIIQKYYPRFCDQMKIKGYDETIIKNIWNTLEKFTNYSFGKGHATSYAVMGYLTMYFKTHYAIYFYSSSLSNLKVSKKQTKLIIAEIIKSNKIKIVCSDINDASVEMNVNYKKNEIAWPMSKIVGLGEKAIDLICQERTNNGPFKSYDDFVFRMRNQQIKLNKNVIINLVKAGAFDYIEKFSEPKERRLLLQHSPELIKYNENWFFQLIQLKISDYAHIDYKSLLVYFKKNVTAYFSGMDIELYSGKQKEVLIAGYIIDVKESQTKKKEKFLSIEIDNNHTIIHGIIWNDIYKKYNFSKKQLLNNAIIVNGMIKLNNNSQNNFFYTNKMSEVKLITL